MGNTILHQSHVLIHTHYIYLTNSRVDVPMQGSALANIIPRYLFGVRATSAGWKKFSVQPSLSFIQRLTGLAEATIPTNIQNEDITITYKPISVGRIIEVSMEAPRRCKGIFIPPPGYQIVMSFQYSKRRFQIIKV